MLGRFFALAMIKYFIVVKENKGKSLIWKLYIYVDVCYLKIQRNDELALNNKGSHYSKNLTSDKDNLPKSSEIVKRKVCTTGKLYKILL